MDGVSKQLEKHEDEDRTSFGVIHSTLNIISTDVSTLKADSKWQTWLLKGIVGAVLAGFITQLYQIIAR